MQSLIWEIIDLQPQISFYVRKFQIKIKHKNLKINNLHRKKHTVFTQITIHKMYEFSSQTLTTVRLYVQKSNST